MTVKITHSEWDTIYDQIFSKLMANSAEMLINFVQSYDYLIIMAFVGSLK